MAIGFDLFWAGFFPIPWIWMFLISFLKMSSVSASSLNWSSSHHMTYTMESVFHIFYLLSGIKNIINTKLESLMIFAVPVRSHVINLPSRAWNTKKQMFHKTGTAHSKWSKSWLNALYECLVLLCFPEGKWIFYCFWLIYWNW